MYINVSYDFTTSVRVPVPGSGTQVLNVCITSVRVKLFFTGDDKYVCLPLFATAQHTCERKLFLPLAKALRVLLRYQDGDSPVQQDPCSASLSQGSLKSPFFVCYNTVLHILIYLPHHRRLQAVPQPIQVFVQSCAFFLRDADE